MKNIALIATLALVVTFVSDAAYSAEKAKAKPKKGKASAELAILADGVFYSQGFEEEDDVDAWATDVNEVEWKKGGANGSKGCAIFSKPMFENKKSGNGPEDATVGFIECEKYVAFKDSSTVIEFDYFTHGIGTSAYVRAISDKTGFSIPIKDVVQEKWAHTSVKVADMKSKGDNLGEGKTFRTHIYVFVGADKKVADQYVLIDNVVIKAGKK